MLLMGAQRRVESRYTGTVQRDAGINTSSITSSLRVSIDETTRHFPRALGRASSGSIGSEPGTGSRSFVRRDITDSTRIIVIPSLHSGAYVFLVLQTLPKKWR